MNRVLFFAFFFVSLNIFSQEIPVKESCDSSAFILLPKSDIKLTHLPCTFESTNKVLLFTSIKQFHNFYKTKKNSYNEGCYSLFGKFDFKKNDLLVLHFDFEPETKANTELRKDGNKYVILIRVKTKMSAMASMPNPYHKYISLPKSTSNIKPEIVVCYSHE